jgi:HEAT repeat protein
LLQTLSLATNLTLWQMAAEALRKSGAPKEICLPALKTKLDSNDEYVRENAAAEVLRSDPSDHDAHVAMMNLVRKSALLADYASEELGRAGPAAREAVPVLKDALKSRNKRVREAAAWALKRIEAPERGK